MSARKRSAATFGLRCFPEARLQDLRYRRYRQVLREGRREVRSGEQDYRNLLASVMCKQACPRLSACEVLPKAIIKDDKCKGRVKQDCLQAYFRAQHLGAEGSKAQSARPPSIVHKVSVAQKCLHFCMTEPQYGRRRRQLQGSLHHDPRRCLQHR